MVTGTVSTPSQPAQSAQSTQPALSRARAPAPPSAPPPREPAIVMRRPSPRDRFLRVAPPLALLIIALLGWQIATQSGAAPAFLLPTPADTLHAFWLALTDGLLPGYAGTTLTESLIGFALGALVALPLGYAIARSRVLASAIQPYLAASQALPAVALAPLLVLWLGYGVPPVALLCALIVFFPSVGATTLGLRLLDRDVLDAARVEGADRWTLLRYIEFPLALPSILSGLRTSLTLSVTGAVVGEFVLGDQGLGGLLNIARGNLDTPLVFATLLMLALLAAALYSAALLVERLVSYLEAA